MGTIISTIGEIENIRWTELRKGDVRKVKRALKINDSDIILELETGEFSVIGHRHTPNGNWAVMDYGLDKFSASVLDGLARIGILNAALVRQHKKDAKVAAARRDRRFQIKRLKEACAALGIAAPEVAE